MTPEIWIAVGVIVAGVLGFFAKRVLDNNDRAHSELREDVGDLRDTVVSKVQEGTQAIAALDAKVEGRIDETNRRFDEGRQNFQQMRADVGDAKQGIARIEGLLEGGRKS